MNGAETIFASEQVKGLVAAVFEYPNLTQVGTGPGVSFRLDGYAIASDDTGHSWAVYHNGPDEILSMFPRVLDAVEFVIAQLLYNRCAAFFASHGLKLADLPYDLEDAPHG